MHEADLLRDAGKGMGDTVPYERIHIPRTFLHFAMMQQQTVL